MPESLVASQIQVPLRLSDDQNSPAMVDKTSGAGSVIVFTIPGDGDWTMWPSSPTFPPVMVDLIDYLVGSGGEESSVDLGGAINFKLDVSAYQGRVGMRNPKNEKTEAVARPIDETKQAKQSEIYKVSFDSINRRGFYDLELNRHTGETEKVLFAAKLDPRESRLKRLPESSLQGDFFGDKVSLVSSQELSEQTVSGGNTEIWLQILMLLFGLLALEQFLGWYWGKKR